MCAGVDPEEYRRVASRFATGITVVTTVLDAALECRTHAVHDGGDHSIVVGEVLGVSRADPDGSPLLYYDGSYHRVHPR